jgi:hypothetical protein
MRFLFTTLQFAESAAYRRVGEELASTGHAVGHVTVSRRAARDLQKAGFAAACLPERLAGLGEFDVAAHAERIEREYPILSLREVYSTDPACRGRDEAWCVERTVRHFVALEAIFDEFAPDVLVPEVGSETMRTAAHVIARERRITTLFMFFTIFPNPLRLYVDEPHAPIVGQEQVRAISDEERAQVEAFIAEYVARDRPTLPHRRPRITGRTLRDFARHVAVAALWERDNEYLVPSRFVTNYVVQRSRAWVSRSLHGTPEPTRPYVYFPLHVTDDFKVKRVIPHCVDQAYLIEQVSDALPQGMDVVLKEHPVSVGRNPLSFLRRLVHRPNVRLVDPRSSSHELIRGSRAVAVISSTVGLEALLHGKPVLTMGQPFYGGYGVTVDVDSFRELRGKVAEVLHYRPDRERTLQVLHAAMRSTRAGAPAAVDPSPGNARRLAASLAATAESARDTAGLSG